MFTGIIREIGTIESVVEGKNSRTLTIATTLSENVKEGDSIAVNGVCLTVLSYTTTSWQARLMQETLDKTTLGSLVVGDHVNLEPALSLGATLDGHIVQGHVGGVCTISDITHVGDDRIFTLSTPPALIEYLIPKGSVALNGVSLTVVDVLDDSFTVSIMPYTLEHTTFGESKVGDRVTMEADPMGKYAVRLIKKYLPS